MGLEEYKRKRKFDNTPEPAGAVKEGRGNGFVIQKHHATRLHYDFRLEMGGVLRSWAIPKGPSFNPAEKRLAMETEDHPIDYGEFEGVIPKGNYGAGKVIIWDNGTYEMVDPETPEKGWKKGKLHFVLRGKKLKGEWVLVRGSREPRQWIFFKVRDSYASTEDDITLIRPESVVSGQLVDEVGEKNRGRHWVTPIERELEQFGMKKAGRSPVPKIVQPMLATLIEKPFDNDEWLFELKLDGMRALAVKEDSKIAMWTRNGKSLTHRFPTLVEAVATLPADRAVLDGEIVALDEAGQAHFERAVEEQGRDGSREGHRRSRPPDACLFICLRSPVPQWIHVNEVSSRAPQGCASKITSRQQRLDSLRRSCGSKWRRIFQSS